MSALQKSLPPTFLLPSCSRQCSLCPFYVTSYNTVREEKEGKAFNYWEIMNVQESECLKSPTVYRKIVLF